MWTDGTYAFGKKQYVFQRLFVKKMKTKKKKKKLMLFLFSSDLVSYYNNTQLFMSYGHNGRGRFPRSFCSRKFQVLFSIVLVLWVFLTLLKGLLWTTHHTSYSLLCATWPWTTFASATERPMSWAHLRFISSTSMCIIHDRVARQLVGRSKNCFKHISVNSRQIFKLIR